MKAYNTPPKLLAVIEQMYENTRAKVISPDRDTDFFLIKAGVLQGDKLAPYLFAILPILIEFMPKKWRAKPKTGQNRQFWLILIEFIPQMWRPKPKTGQNQQFWPVLIEFVPQSIHKNATIDLKFGMVIGTYAFYYRDNLYDYFRTPSPEP